MGCSRNAALTEAKEKLGTAEKSRFFVLSSIHKLQFFDDSLFPAGTIGLPSEINRVQQETDLYLIGGSVYSFSPSKKSIRFLFESEKKTDEIIYGDFNKIIMLDNSVIIKDSYGQSNILKTDAPLTGMWKNPYHNYVYVQDSTGYIYSLDYDHSVLKRRIYSSPVKNLFFYKKGTRLFISTEKSFMLLDYETLNLLFEEKKTYNAFCECSGLSRLYMLNNEALSIDMLNSITFRNEGKINISSPAVDMSCNEDSMLALLMQDGKRLYVFKSKKMIKDTVFTFPAQRILGFFDKDIILISDTIIYHYNLSNGIMSILCSQKDVIEMNMFHIEGDAPVENIYVEPGNKTEKNVTGNKKGTVYSVQIFSLDNEPAAKTLVAVNKKKIGIDDVFIKSADVGGKTFFRVYAGKFDTKAEAETFKKTLLTKGFADDILIMRLEL